MTTTSPALTEQIPAVPSLPRSKLGLKARTITALAGLIAVALTLWIAWTEGPIATVILTLSVSATLAALIVLATRRPLIAVVLTAAHVTLVTVLAMVKHKYMNMVLHAYDIVYYAMSTSTIDFVVRNYGRQVLLVMAVAMLACLTAVIAYRIDPIRIRRPVAAAFALAFACVATLAGLAVDERRHALFEYEGMYVSSFYRSWAETIETLARGQLIEAASATPGAPPLLPKGNCVTEQKPPHIILVHHESLVQPGLFPTVSYDRRLDDFFRSDDGQSYRLRVETYGGASVLTEFSVMTGLSTYSFGGMRLFVQQLMAGKVGETLPQVLAKCGYRNVMYYPMLRSFTSADRFFKGVGFDEMLDLRDQKATRVNERDRFYYDNALDGLARHIANSEAPLFTFIETMAGHWPYDHAYEPHLDVPGGAPGTDPEMHEVLRRLWLARLDYQHLVDELARRFPDDRFLIVRYSDHHPMATRTLLNHKVDTEAEDVLLDRNSIGFQTFFTVHGLGFTPQFTSPALLDVPFLSTVLLEASGLPLSDAYKRRQELKRVCGGLWFDCPKRDLILGFHRQLLDNGLMSAR